MPCEGLYIHVPFCESKCPYCDFYSVPADETLMNAYCNTVLRALEMESFGLDRIDTVYFGGGTPSVLGGKRIGRILDAVSARYTVSKNAEITVECNPHSSLEAELSLMRVSGANRISIGMQSADNTQLKRLGRLHTTDGVRNAADAAFRCGFSHLSLDLMLATPGQTKQDIQNAVAFCSELHAEHVSAYLLKVEPETPFAKKHIELQCPDEDGQADLYLFAVNALAKAGYQQYEISNFAKAGQVAQHNLKYWNCEEYVGIGPSAHSFVNGRRCYFDRDLHGFLNASNPWELLCDDGEGGSAEEYIMLRARLTEGLNWDCLTTRYPRYDQEKLRKNARPLEKGGLVAADQNGLRLTVNGFLLSNAVIGTLLD